MDTIFLRDMKVETVIGIWEWERKIRQTVSIDLDMSADIRKAAASDSVDDTLNYKSVAKRLQAFVGDSSFQLVETLAEKIAAIVLEEFAVEWVRVRLSKPGAIRGAIQAAVQRLPARAPVVRRRARAVPRRVQASRRSAALLRHRAAGPHARRACRHALAALSDRRRDADRGPAAAAFAIPEGRTRAA